MSSINNLKQGFTIIELLIVVVVIAILASITIVAYTGIQNKARYSVMMSDFDTLRKAIEMYRAENGRYPDSTLCVETPGQNNYGYFWCGWNQGEGDSFIPGLAPKYLAVTPHLDPSLPHGDTYLYQSRGYNGLDQGTTQYQLLRFRSEGLTAAEMAGTQLLATGNGYDGIAWGYRSDPSFDWY